jgi:hypothetical protein
LLVSIVREQGPAERAGLKREDLITAVNGRPISRRDDFLREVRSLGLGDRLALSVQRPPDGKVTGIELCLGQEPPGPGAASGLSAGETSRVEPAPERTPLSGASLSVMEPSATASGVADAMVSRGP